MRLLGSSLCLIWLAATGCTDGGPTRPGREGNPPSAKMTTGLRVVFEEPGDVVAGEEFPMGLSIEGTPGERLRLRLHASEGVVLSRYVEETGLVLDAGGKARLSLAVRVPRPRGCSVVARVRTEDGRVEEGHCVIGGAEAADVEIREMEDGSRVRISPSR